MIGTAHTLFEHEKKPYSELGWSVDHPIVEQIDSINNLQKKELIHLGRKDLRATQYVGLMQLGDVSIQVLPKITNTLIARKYHLIEDMPAQLPI